MAISEEDLAQLVQASLAEDTEPSPGSAHHDALTDYANAELLCNRHGQDLRYVGPWNRWLNWRNGVWKEDTKGRAVELAKQTLRLLLADAALIEDDRQRNRRIKDIIGSERASRIRGMLELAQSQPPCPIDPDELDADPWLWNCTNGTLDLNTGHLREARRDDLLTKQAPVSHDPHAQAPVWRGFLNRVLPDPEVREFVQRAAGYCMVGGNPEQILLILYGSGANGKSTFLETTRALFGAYGQQAPPETFLERRDSIPNDVARLRGARLVAATEIAEGRRLNEPLIKRMTGGDTMTARFMRSEYFEFQPQFTPWLATNHRPEIRGTDEAIWRRIRLIPFTETIPQAERDGNLKDKLRAELPGILNWALDGCLAWQADGLNTPPGVTVATSEYRGEMDLIGGFLEDCCHVDDSARELSAALYAAYHTHAKSNGNDPITSQTFGRRLSERGFKRLSSRAGRTWEGVRLKSDQTDLEI
jgi:putative DNA primase/helicase